MATVKELIKNYTKATGNQKEYSNFSNERLQEMWKEIAKAHEEEIEKIRSELRDLKDINKGLQWENKRLLKNVILNKPKLYKEDFKKVDHYNRCDGNCCHPKKCDGKGTSWFTYELKDNSKWDKLESKEEKEDE